MRPSTLSATATFQNLQRHAIEAKETQLSQLFAANPNRFPALTLDAAGLFLDYSKNRVNATTMELLFALARERNVEPLRDAMFAGEKINSTERRAVLHTALRAPRGKALSVEGQNINQDVHAVLDSIKNFTDRVRSGQWLGYTGKAITDVVNVGIGGSDLGPKMVCQALRPYSQKNLTTHFVANVDGHALDAVLAKVNPETTLFIVASKTFTTTETMMNAQSARQWFLGTAGEQALPKHFVALSTNVPAAQAFGIAAENIFPFWDWVGGRYSIWSAIGLSVALAIGFEQFQEFLAGAHAMDEHFCNAPLEKNMPAILALIGFWNRNFLGCSSLSIAPYHQDLAYFAAYLQQLDMESNGKRVARDGSTLDVESCPVIWGDVGTNGQHAYFQLLHQGTDVVPVDFIASLKASHVLPGHQAAILANCFAQSEAFMRGKSGEEARSDMKAQGMADDDIEALVPHRTFPGNRPTNTILMEKLTPATLGALIALYEHKVFVQGAIWGVNSYDQWGVELGKVLAKNINAELIGAARPETHDSSTNGLISRARAAL